MLLFHFPPDNMMVFSIKVMYVQKLNFYKWTNKILLTGILLSTKHENLFIFDERLADACLHFQVEMKPFDAITADLVT